jgi:hypothetical protein
MCGGAKKAHHARQEAMRQATRESNMFAAQIRAAEERNKALADALKPDPEKYTPPPTTVNAMLGVRGIKPKKGAKASTLGSRRGIGQLRIPLNIGTGSGGTNVPS